MLKKNMSSEFIEQNIIVSCLLIAILRRLFYGVKQCPKITVINKISAPHPSTIVHTRILVILASND